MGIGEGYAQAGAATFSAGVDWLLFNKQLKATEAAQQQAYDLARQGQLYGLQQQALQNAMQQQGIDLQKQQFDFGKMRWGEEFGLTKKQIAQQMKIAKKQEKRNQEAFDIDKRRSALKNMKDLNSVTM